jgi:hypothetical protein
MLSVKEQEVLKLFRYPRTLEGAFRRSEFRGFGNFKLYISRLKEKGLLIEFVRKEKNKDTFTIEFEKVLKAVDKISGVFAGFCATFVPMYMVIQYMR